MLWYKLAKEALVTQGDCFLDRNISPLFDKVFKGNGEIHYNGYKWRRQRHFSINHLKNFGEGKRTLELHIQLESNFLYVPSVSTEKVQEEIDRVIGQSRQPCLSDRANMPYTEAVIHETQRLRSILPLNVPRLCNKDTYVGGYFIPQGTTLLVNLSSVLHDWTMWETPHRFNPQHFLDENGCFRKREAFYPFSVGRRMCLGEQLARMELFLFFTALLQRFSISPVPGQEVSFDTQGNVILGPKPFHICVKDR
uniref:Uncharacterized protein n=1 Tax=Myripristis murdjan TaxID=586833 RepID=A0A667Z2S1_9TELE